MANDNTIEVVVRTVDEATAGLQDVARGVTELSATVAAETNAAIDQLSLAPITQELEEARSLSEELGASVSNVAGEFQTLADTPVAAEGFGEAIDSAQQLSADVEGVGEAIEQLDAKRIVQEVREMAKAIADSKQEARDLAREAQNVGSKFDEVGRGLRGLRRLAGGVLAFIGFRSFIDNIAKAEAATVRLDAAFQNMGAGAGVTRKQLDDLIVELERTTVVPRTAVEDAAALLLSFSSITGQAFERTIRVANDLAVLLGGDLTSATQQVARALQDPANRLGLLSRVGVKLSDDTEKVIDRLVELGRVSEAQDILLKALEDRVGGIAAKMRGTLAGALDGLRKQLSEVFEGDASSFGQATVAIENFTKTLQDPKIKEGVDILVAGLATLAARLLEITALAPRAAIAYGEAWGRFAHGSDEPLQIINDKLRENLELQKQLEGRIAAGGDAAFQRGGETVRAANVQRLRGELAKLQAQEQQLRRGRAQELEEIQRLMGAADEAKRAAAEAAQGVTDPQTIGSLSDGLKELNITAQRIGETGAQAIARISEEIRLNALPEVKRLAAEWKTAEADIEAAHIVGEIDLEEANAAIDELTDKFLQPLEIKVDRIDLPPVPERELSVFGQRAGEVVQDSIATVLRGFGSDSGRDIARNIIEAIRETFIQTAAARLGEALGLDRIIAGRAPSSGLGNLFAKLFGTREDPAARVAKQVREGTIQDAEAAVANVLGAAPVQAVPTAPDSRATRTPAPAGAAPSIIQPVTAATREVAQAVDRLGECPCPTEALADLAQSSTEVRDSVTEQTTKLETAVNDTTEVLRESSISTDSTATRDIGTQIETDARTSDSVTEVLSSSIERTSAQEVAATQQLERTVERTTAQSSVEHETLTREVATSIQSATTRETIVTPVDGTVAEGQTVATTIERSSSQATESVSEAIRDSVEHASDKEISAVREVLTEATQSNADTASVISSEATSTELRDAVSTAVEDSTTESATATAEAMERTSDQSTAEITNAIRESTTQLSEVIRENSQQTSVIEQQTEREILRESGDVSSVIERSTTERQTAAGTEEEELSEITINAEPIGEAVSRAVDKIPPIFERGITGLGRLLAGSLGELGEFISVAVGAISKLVSGTGGGIGGGSILAGIGSAIGSLFFSEGGLVRGPGTGTSDSIPAVTRRGQRIRLSDEEFVTREKVVKQRGVLPFLSALNEGADLQDLAAGVLGLGGSGAPSQALAAPMATSGRAGGFSSPAFWRQILPALGAASGLATGGLVGSAMATPLKPRVPLVLPVSTNRTPGLADGGLISSVMMKSLPVPVPVTVGGALGLASGGLVGSVVRPLPLPLTPAAPLNIPGLAGGGLVGSVAGERGSVVNQASQTNVFQGSTYHVNFNGSRSRDDDATWVQFVAWADRRDRETERRILQRMKDTGFGRLR